MALPQIDLTSVIHCVARWSKFDYRWKGVAAKHLVHILKVAEGATHCVLYCPDGYTSNVRVDRLSADDVILAHSWNGALPTDVHG